jgi:hypothetical protein
MDGGGEMMQDTHNNHVSLFDYVIFKGGLQDFDYYMTLSFAVSLGNATTDTSINDNRIMG